MISNISNSSVSGFPYGGASSGSFGIILVIIALVLTVRIYRSIKGTKYSLFNVYRLPVMYLFLNVIYLLYPSPNPLEIVIAIVAIVIGYFVGLRLATGLKFFEKNGATYYTRSIFIMAVWLVSFIARFGIETFFHGNVILNLVVAIALAGTTGMILGEATHITNKYKEYKKS